MLLKIAPEIRHLPANTAFGHYLAESTVRPRIVAIGSILLVYGWIAMWFLALNLLCGLRNDVILVSKLLKSVKSSIKIQFSACNY